ncbi:MAG: hypothetical protein QXT26_06695, partial [Thermoproteota archaeon]
TFLDWIYNPPDVASLDAAVKYAGNSSLLIQYSSPTMGNIYSATRKNFSCTEVMVVLWVKIRADSPYGLHAPQVYHPGYGALTLEEGSEIDWTKFRATFWYDSVNDTRWGRVEKWDGTTWVQQGSDVNFGRGPPAAGSISIQDRASGTSTFTFWCWFDEVEVYTR